MSTTWSVGVEDCVRHVSGNVFRTKEECIESGLKDKARIRIQDKYQEFLDKAGVVLDWTDGNEEKCNLYYNHDTKEWELYNSWGNQFTNTELHSTGEGCIWVRDNMEADLKLVWGIEG